MPVRVLALLFSLCAVASAAPGGDCPSQTATPPGKRTPEAAASAKALFDKGIALQGGGKIDEACKMFESSLLLDPQIGTRLNVAECRELRGRLVEAHALFADAAAEAAKINDRRVGFAQQRVSALEAKLVKVSVKLAEPGLDGLVVKIGACVIDPSAQLYVMAGPVAVEVVAAGRKPYRVEQSGTAGGELTVDVPALVPYDNPEEERKAKEAEALAAVERRKTEEIIAEREQRARYDRHPARTWMLVTGALGVAAAGTGVYFGVSAHRAQTAFDDAGCGDRTQLLDDPTYTRCGELRDTGNRDALLSNVLVASGAAVLITSAIVFVVDPGNVERPRELVGITPHSIHLTVHW